MAKKESSFKNMVIVLFLVSALAATALAFVYQATKEPIAKAKLEKKNKAISMVLPKFDTVDAPVKVAIAEGDSLECYPAKKGNKVIGYAIETYTTKGFSGIFKIMVGFTLDGKIFSTSVLEHKETPGLGDKMQKSKSDWSNQFSNLDVASQDTDGDGIYIEVTKDKGTIQAITASTISSRGFCDACEKAYKAFNILIKTNKDN